MRYSKSIIPKKFYNDKKKKITNSQTEPTNYWFPQNQMLIFSRAEY